jgi:hypothetical protein
MRTVYLQRAVSKQRHPEAFASYRDTKHTEQCDAAVTSAVHSFPPGQDTCCFYKIRRSITVFTDSSTCTYPDQD